MEKLNITKENKALLKCKLKGIEPLLVVAGLIEKDGKYLIGKRIYGDEGAVEKWEFPGGKVEKGEKESEAIERELKEEFGLNIKADNYLCSTIHEYPTRTINLKLWHANVVDEDFLMNKKDHDAYKWVSLEEISNYPLAPADDELYCKINI